ncbi:MAG: hypothetical protein AB2693_26250, partial [Candidatus Thiodiazotropha sp.]
KKITKLAFFQFCANFMKHKIIRIGIKSQTSSSLGQIGISTSEILALEDRKFSKKSHRLTM